MNMLDRNFPRVNNMRLPCLVGTGVIFVLLLYCIWPNALPAVSEQVCIDPSVLKAIAAEHASANQRKTETLYELSFQRYKQFAFMAVVPCVVVFVFGVALIGGLIQETFAAQR